MDDLLLGACCIKEGWVPLPHSASTVPCELSWETSSRDLTLGILFPLAVALPSPSSIITLRNGILFLLLFSFKLSLEPWSPFVPDVRFESFSFSIFLGKDQNDIQQ